MNKYQKPVLPTPEEAIQMADDREQWAEQAATKDMLGSAFEMGLTALLLRFYAEHRSKDR